MTRYASAVAAMIGLARTQVGVHEGRSGGRWNNHQRYSDETPGLEWSQGQPWCHTFLSWLAYRSDLREHYPVTASCDAGRTWWKERKLWSDYPSVGALVYFGTEADASHVGLVIGFDDDSITTIEGNTNDNGSREGDGVYLRHHVRRASRIVGYGAPFALGLVTADPGRRRPAPKHPRVEAVMSAAPGPDRYAAMERLALKGAPSTRVHARRWLRGEQAKRDALQALRGVVAGPR